MLHSWYFFCTIVGRRTSSISQVAVCGVDSTTYSLGLTWSGIYTTFGRWSLRLARKQQWRCTKLAYKASPTSTAELS